MRTETNKMTFRVKRLEPETVFHETTTGRVQVGLKTQRHVSYAVVDGNDRVVKTDSGQYEIFPRKAVAEEVAKWYNGNIPTTENRVALGEEADTTRLS